MKGSHSNRNATREEMAHATQVIQEAFPEYEVVWGCHGDFSGHRAPRDHTLAFRLRDRWGKYHSNVIWIWPHGLSSITVEWVRAMVKRGTGHQPRSRRDSKQGPAVSTSSDSFPGAFECCRNLRRRVTGLNSCQGRQEIGHPAGPIGAAAEAGSPALVLGACALFVGLCVGAWLAFAP